MCVTNDAKSPKSPLHAARGSAKPLHALQTRGAPVVRLGERRLLVAEQPAVAVRGVDDVHVAPLKRTRRWCKRRLRELALVDVRVVVVVVAARARGRGEQRDEAEERAGERHGRRRQRWREARAPVALGRARRGYIWLATMCGEG